MEDQPLPGPIEALAVIARQQAMVTPTLRHLELYTLRGLVSVLWHEPGKGGDGGGEGAAIDAALVLCGGAMGGLLGPAEGLYQRLGETWSARGVPVLRVTYRRPNDLDACCLDVAAAVEMATRAGARRVVVMGHSFGGAVAVRVGVVMDDVAGVVTFSTQSAGCEVAAGLRGRPLLLFHGERDELLPVESSQIVRAMAGAGDVVVIPGEGHLLASAGPVIEERLEAWLPPVLRA